MGQSFSRKLAYYCRNSHLHGLKYFTNGKNHPVLRFLWIMVFFTCCIGMVLTFLSLFSTYTKNSISFLTETTYLEWNTTFPAVTVCQISGMDVASLNNELEIDDNENIANVEFFIADLLFFTGSCYSCQTQCHSCSKLNISYVVNKLRKPCTKLFQKCKWNNKEFDCCNKFLPLDTEYGVCFSLNSLHTMPTKKSHISLSMNRKTGTGELILKTTEDVRIYYHAPEDVPFINSESNYRKDVMIGDTYEILFNVIEIENDENVKTLPIEKRNCRFPWEVPAELKVHKLYSYSTCMVQCHAENHIRLCNCTHHLMPVYNREKYCDMEGLKCLTENFEIVNRIHAKGYDKLGLICDCLPSCVEPEYTIVSDEKTSEILSSGISIKMQSLPTSRFKRIVVKSAMDLVVSIGGAAGLFIGASLLSIVELIYMLFLKK